MATVQSPNNFVKSSSNPSVRHKKEVCAITGLAGMNVPRIVVPEAGMMYPLYVAITMTTLLSGSSDSS